LNIVDLFNHKAGCHIPGFSGQQGKRSMLLQAQLFGGKLLVERTQPDQASNRAAKQSQYKHSIR
jgi:hypothetical protein